MAYPFISPSLRRIDEHFGLFHLAECLLCWLPSATRLLNPNLGNDIGRNGRLTGLAVMAPFPACV